MAEGAKTRMESLTSGGSKSCGQHEDAIHWVGPTESFFSDAELTTVAKTP